MTKTLAYAAATAHAPLAPHWIDRREPGAEDVLLDILYCGVCHSDLSQVRDEWGGGLFPMVPGHEIVGRVARVGERVTRVKVGDLAAVGTVVDSCRDCETCRRDLEQFCEKGSALTYNGTEMDRKTPTQGGYSSRIVVAEHFTYKVPDGLEPAAVAPLLCAGITTYAPLRHWGAGPGKKVAVVGLGGLGHMAVKLAHAMGAEVTVLSQSLGKKEDGLRLGADHYFATKDPETFKALAGTFDLIVNTVSAKIDLDAYLSLLALDGALVNVGAPSEPLSVNVFSLIMTRRSFAGSLIGGIRQTQEMLDFCAQHHLGADIEVIPASRINEAYERVLASEVRYRFVIDTSTLKQS